jgi:Holliday junction resolvase RusA-like endonuclease
MSGAQGYKISTLGNGRVTAETVRAKRKPVFTDAPGPWSFTVDGAPVGKGRPRGSVIGGKIVMRTPTKTRQYERWVALCARPFMPREKIGGPIAVTLEFVTVRPARLKDSQRDEPDVGAGDVDNYAKAILDGLSAHFDDHLVTGIVARKRYADPGEKPHARVRVSRFRYPMPF